jgi:23S rRNA-/tRNA-specific pseudouridylate synthase
MATYQAAPTVPNKSQSDVDGTQVDSSRLEDYSAEKCILHMDEHYILVNKPPNVRMDGDFNVTLQKLLLAWVPNADLSNIKWVHQLDYATSGIICIARTKPAAGLAVAAFQKRETTKQYLAVVEGHIDTSRWPVQSGSDILAAAGSASAPALSVATHGTLRKPDDESLSAVADAGQPHKLRRKSRTTVDHDGHALPPQQQQQDASQCEAPHARPPHAAGAVAQGQKDKQFASDGVDRMRGNESTGHGPGRGQGQGQGQGQGGSWQDAALRETLDVHYAALQSLIAAHVTRAVPTGTGTGTGTSPAIDTPIGTIETHIATETETDPAISGIDSGQAISPPPPPPPPSHAQEMCIADILEPFVAMTYDELVADSRKRKALRKALARCGVHCGSGSGNGNGRANVNGEVISTGVVANSGKKAKKTDAAAAAAATAAAAVAGGADATLSVHDGGQTGIFREATSYPSSADHGAGAGAGAGVGVGADDGQADLLVNIPVAEIAGDFRCEVGHEGNAGRPAVTRVHVLRRDTYNGRPVTKVLLTPHTGRRHQLRVHCRCLGHPIVGDATYGYPEAVTLSLQHNETRMLLHAYKLEIRVSAQAMAALRLARYRELVRPEADTVLVRGEAPDPFEEVLLLALAGCARPQAADRMVDEE